VGSYAIFAQAWFFSKLLEGLGAIAAQRIDPRDHQDMALHR
jgi:hypothetical protein